MKDWVIILLLLGLFVLAALELREGEPMLPVPPTPLMIDVRVEREAPLAPQLYRFGDKECFGSQAPVCWFAEPEDMN